MRHASDSGKYLKSIAFPPMPVRAGGRHLQEEAVWPQLLFLPTILYPPLSLQSLGRFCQAAVSLVGAPPVYVQCISRILVGQGDHGDPPPPQHAWSFTGSNKPTLYSKEKFGSNKPAFRQWHFKPFRVKTTWDLLVVHKRITFLQRNNIRSWEPPISRQHASSIFLVPRWNRVYGDTRSNVNTLWPPSSPMN